MSAERGLPTAGNDRVTRIEELLEHREWLRDLSRRLVADANVADDLVQKTWLAAIERPPRDSDRPRAWLATVMRNWLRREWRDDGTKRRHEHAAAQPEAIAGPDEMVARAEEVRHVVDAVLALDEPYRTTLLYRHHEGLAPRHIAERMGVPVETVRTRIKRALAAVRRDLDERHGGDGKSWALALLPITHMPVTYGPGSPLPGTDGAAGHSLGGLAVKTTISKGAVAAAVIVLLLLGGGAMVALQGSEGTAAQANAGGAAGVADTRGRRHVAEVPSENGERPDNAAAGERDESPERSDLTHQVRVAVCGADGRPLAGAVVTFFPAVLPFSFQSAWEQTLALLDPLTPVASATTGNDGRLTVELPGSGPWAMVTRADNHTTSLRRSIRAEEIAAATNENDVVSEQLVPGHEIRGRLVDREGAPRAGLSLAGVAASTALSPIRAARDESGADGSFRLTGLASGDVRVYVDAARVATVRAPQAGPIDIVVDGYALEGRVTMEGDGSPVAGVRVIAAMGGGTDGFAVTQTDSDGRYTLDTHVRSMVTEVRLAKPPLADTRASTRIPLGVGFGPDGRAELDFTMTTGATVTGVAHSASGPIDDLELTLTMADLRQFVARTDATGRYTIEGLPTGAAVVRVNTVRGPYSQRGLVPRWLQALRSGDPPAAWTVHMTAGETSTFDVELDEGVSVAGIVRLPDGTPAVGATVRVSGSPATKTDEAGAFQCTGARPRDAAGAWATLGDLRASQTVTVASDGSTDDISLTLAAPFVVTGRVADESDAPIPGAEIEYLVEGRPRSSADPFRSAERISADADGTFSIRVFVGSSREARAVEVRAVAPAYIPTAAKRAVAQTADAAEGAGLAFVLVPAPSLTGTIRTGDREPVAGARVHLQPGPLRPNGEREKRLTVAATSAADGTFTIAAVPPGEWTIFVDAPDRVRWIETFDVPRATPIEAVMDASTRIAGRLTIADGSSPHGTFVILRRQGAQPGEVGSYVSVLCGADGWFEATGLPKGVYDLSTFTRSQANASVLKAELQGVDSGRTDVALEMRTAGTIDGRVLDPDGKPVVGVNVQAFSEADKPGTPYGTSDANGVFRIGGLAHDAGPFTLRAKPPEPQRFPNFEVLGQLTGTVVEGVEIGRIGLEITLPVGRTIEGVVVDGDGAPRPDVWVTAECVTNGEVQPHERTWLRAPAAQADREGHFRIEGLPDAAFALFVVTDPFARAGGGKPEALIGGTKVRSGTSGLSLRAAETGSITGLLVDHDGTPITGQSIHAVPTGQSDSLSARRSTRTTDGGRFELTGIVLEQTYIVRVSRSERVPVQLHDAVAGSEPRRIMLSLGESIAGKLAVPEGQSAKQRYLRLTHTSEPFDTALMTADDGTFARNALVPGTYRVEIQTNPGKWPAVMRELGTITTGATDIELRLLE